MKPTSLLLALSLLAAGASAQELWISGYDSNALHRHDLATGVLLGKIPAVPGAQSMRYGPDGQLYVVSEKANEVLRFDGQTGAALGVFVGDDPLTPADETGGLDGPTAAVFGPTGELLVGSFNTDSVLRYDGTTGAFLGVLVGSGAGGLNGPDAGMVLGPDGALHVPGFYSNAVHRYDAVTGADLGDFVAPGSGGLSRPRMLRFRSDGWLYVSSWGNAGLKRFDASGGFVDTLLATHTPTGFVFEPGTGHLLVCSDNQNNVRRFDRDTGSLINVLVKKGTGGLDGATFLQVLPDPRLELVGLSPGVAAQANQVFVRGATPSSPLLYAIGGQSASQELALTPPVHLGVAAPTVIVLTSSATGSFTHTLPPDASLTGLHLVHQVFDVATGRISNLVIQTLG